MGQKQTTFPHFIELTDLSEPGQRFWVNANLIEHIGSSSYRGSKGMLVMTQGKEIYVKETPGEIFERIYDSTINGG